MLTLTLFSLTLFAFQQLHQPCPANLSEPLYPKAPGVTAPIPDKIVGPTDRVAYSNTARYSEGVLRFVVQPSGVPCNIEVLYVDFPPAAPGFIDAMVQWRFKPAKKDDHPIAVYGIVEMNTSRGDRASKPGTPSAREDRFNQAVKSMSSPDPAKRREAIDSLVKLSAAAYPAADAFVGLATLNGELGFPKDPAAAKQLILRSLPTGTPAILYAYARILLAEQSREEAIHYLRLAALGNHVAARKLLDSLPAQQ
jgi:hypothetical protein